MAWIGLTDASGGVFDRAGVASKAGVRNTLPPPQGGLCTGSLTIETRITAHSRPRFLLKYDRQDPDRFSIAIQALPKGGFALQLGLGQTDYHALLPYHPDGLVDILRLVFHWNAQTGKGLFGLEVPETGDVQFVQIATPAALPLADLAIMMRFATSRLVDTDVDYIALSDQAEPLGPQPGLAGNVMIDTPQGARPVSSLKRGDHVLDPAGNPVPVLFRIARQVPARGRFRPIRLRAPYFGLTRDILIAPEQRLVVSGNRVEYLFGKEAVLLPARHLISGTAATHAEAPGFVTYHQLVLPRHMPLVASGTLIDSFCVSRLRRRKDLLPYTALRGFDRAKLPEHVRADHPVLSPFEARVLSDYRAA